jgi:TonB family protein
VAEFISQETAVSKLSKYLYSFALFALIIGLAAFTHGDEARKIKSKVSPQYPVLARKMNVSGSVKLEVFVAANGQVKSVKPLGGHPLLIDAAESAVKQWRYEPGAEGPEIVEIRFHSAD